METFSTDKGEYGREEIEAAIAETVPASEGSWKKLSWLLEHAKRDVPPNLDIGNAQPEFLLLASFCREAQRRSRLGSFFLSCRTAGQLLGVPYQTAARWLKRLQTLGVLKLCERGTRATGNASRFRYLGELAAVEPATVGQVVA